MKLLHWLVCVPSKDIVYITSACVCVCVRERGGGEREGEREGELCMYDNVGMSDCASVSVHMYVHVC